MSREPARSDLKFFGGRVCLDYLNSLNWRLTDAPVELVPDYAGLLDWSGRRGTLSKRAVEALRGLAASDPERATDLVKDVHRLRADLIEAVDDLRHGIFPDVGPTNRALADLPPQPRLSMEEGRFVFDLDGSDLRQPLWPILWSLTAVLASSDAGRIGCCGAAGCGWFFVDESPNRSRLWCNEGCGNRERVRRSYNKRRTDHG
jgi:predicted RNA-binding Zn ribbon-like protein